MKKKKLLDLSFILISSAILIVLMEFIQMPRFMGFALIPLIIAYHFGQYVGRTTKQESE